MKFSGAALVLAAASVVAAERLGFDKTVTTTVLDSTSTHRWGRFDKTHNPTTTETGSSTHRWGRFDKTFVTTTTVIASSATGVNAAVAGNSTGNSTVTTASLNGANAAAGGVAMVAAVAAGLLLL